MAALHRSNRTLSRRLAGSSGVLLLWLAAAGLTGCSSWGEGPHPLGFLAPYRMEVVQGNVVTKEMAAQLRPGLSRDQVRMLMGSPLLMDVFHANRWDYVFTIRRQGTLPQQRRVSVFFEADRVSRFEADTLPSEREFVASIDSVKSATRKTPLELDEAQLRAIPLPPPSRSAVQGPGTAASSGPARSYPPLETSAR